MLIFKYFYVLKFFFKSSDSLLYILYFDIVKCLHILPGILFKIPTLTCSYMSNCMCCFLLSDAVHHFTRSYMSVHGKTVTLHVITRYFSCNNYVSFEALSVILRSVLGTANIVPSISLATVSKPGSIYYSAKHALWQAHCSKIKNLVK